MKVVGINRVVVNSDSQLVIDQVHIRYEAKEDWMKKYMEKFKRFQGNFVKFKIKNVPHEQNA